MQKYVIASNNEHKVKEFQNMLKPFGIKVVPYKDVIKEEFEIEETGKTFEENAKIKAEAICEKTGLPTFADDSGFCVKDLNSFPGLYSARFAEEVGGYDKAFDEIKSRLNGKISEAKFVCVIAFASKGEKTLTFEGSCYGFTVFPARGENGFGYDSIFVPNSYGITFAEMESDEKNAISHRAMASAKFLKFIEELKKAQEKKSSVKSAGSVKASSKKVEEVVVSVVEIEDKIQEKVEEQVEVLSEEKKENIEDVFDIEVDEKFDAPEVPFSNVDIDEKN